MHPLSLLIPTAYADACPSGYRLLAPIGTFNNTDCYSLTQYLNGIFETVIGIAGILAVVMIVICGIRLMSTPSVSGRSEAKECIYNALFGVLIAIGSWLLLNTINPQLLKNDAAIGVQSGVVGATPTTPVATVQPQPQGDGCYFRYKELDTGNVKYSQAPTGAMCDITRTDFRSNANIDVQTSCFCNQSGTLGTPTASKAPPASGVGGSIACPLSGLNLCEPQFRQCGNAQCGKLRPGMTATFAAMAAANAGHTGMDDGAELIKAIIMQESSCGLQLVGDGGKSCGPMHIQPATANRFLDACGLAEPVTCGWLTEPANFDKAICLGAEYIQSLTDTACGDDIRNVAAGYNGGPGSCQNSTNCSGDASCDGTPVKRWECLYDDNAHQQCNSGYTATKNYATKVLYCTQNPGY